MKLPITIITLILICSFIANSQNETKKWYFGNQAGLDFSTNPPTVLTNGVMSTSEGCASISDASGNILFYTDGLTVYNQLHTIMANGTGLFGNGSTTQSGIIIKQPGNTNIYYIFTQDDVAGPNGLCYSVVDMNLAAGMGSVTVKNFSLYTPSCEKITAVRHCNGVDVWVVSHDWNSNNFRTYLVTAAGVSLTPIISSVGSVVSNTPSTAVALRTLGQMKISPNGRTLGLAVYDNTSAAPFEIYDFDPSTGIVSNPLVLINTLSNYGCEFSADGTKFYGGVYQGGKIFQWDLCAGSPTAVVASINTITPVTSSLSFGSLQLASDGKIYVARAGQALLALIQNPNNLGAASNYTDVGISIAPKISNLGLPNFVNSFFKTPVPPFTHTISCQTVNFMAPPTPSFNTSCIASGYSLTGFQWNFGEPASGASNTSTATNPTHTYSVVGTYTVQYIQYTPCSSDTIKIPVTVQSLAPSLNLTGVFSICKGDKRVYTASGANNYSWTTSTNLSSNTSSIILTPTANITITLTGVLSSGGCTSSKVVSITVKPCTDIDELNYNSPIIISPNPFNQQLEITLGTAMQIILLNQNGQVILNQQFEAGNRVIDTSEFYAGLYTLRAVSSKGIQTHRLLKIN